MKIYKKLYTKLFFLLEFFEVIFHYHHDIKDKYKNKTINFLYKKLLILLILFYVVLNAQTIRIEDNEKSYASTNYGHCSNYDLSDSKSEISPKLANYNCIHSVDFGKFKLISYSGYSLSFNKTCVQIRGEAAYKFTGKTIYECEVECKNTCPSGQIINDNCECIPDCLADEEYISSTNQCCPKLNKDFIHLESTMDECVITNPDVIAPDGSSWFVDNIYYSECNDDCIVEKKDCSRGEIISDTECVPPEPEENFCPIGKVEKRFSDCKSIMCISKIVGSTSNIPHKGEFDGECSIQFFCRNNKGEVINRDEKLASCGKLGEEDPIFKILETPDEELNTTTKKEDLIPELEPLELNSESINNDDSIPELEPLELNSKSINDDKDYNITKNTDTNISSVSKVHDTKLESYDFNKDGDNNISTNGEPINKDSTSDKVNKKSDNDKEYDSHETSDSAGSSENAEDGLMGKLESLLDFFSNPSGKIENAMNSIIKSDLVNRRYNFSKTCPIIKTVQIRLFNRDIVFMSQSFLDKYVYVDLFKSFIILIFVITAFKHAMRNN